MTAVRCRHRWRYVGPAPEFAGQPCVLYRCDDCGKTWEVFSGCVPGGRSVIVEREPVPDQASDVGNLGGGQFGLPQEPARADCHTDGCVSGSGGAV